MKTFLVHFSSDNQDDLKLDQIIAFAKQQDAFLVGLFTKKIINYYGHAAPIGAGVTTSLFLGLDEFQEEEDARASRIKDKFTAACDAALVGNEWREQRGYASQLILSHSRLADLVIMSHDKSWANSVSGLDKYLIGDLLKSSPAPFLLLPKPAVLSPSIGTALISWKESNEAAKALKQALPFIDKSIDLKVLSVTGRNEKGPFGNIDISFVATYLARAGYDVKAITRDANEGSVGQAILSVGREQDCEMLVMGAYSRSRLSEQIFGGATEFLLDNSNIPLLVS
jgi:nucleotide-binding universal stress UspA family protein